MAVHSTRRTSPMLKFLTLALVVAVASAIVMPKIEPRDFATDMLIIAIIIVIIIIAGPRNGPRGDYGREGNGNANGNGAPESGYPLRQAGVMPTGGNDSASTPQPPPGHVHHVHSRCPVSTSLGLDRFQECSAMLEKDTALMKSLGDPIKANGHLDDLIGTICSADSFASMHQPLEPFINYYADIVTPDSPLFQCIASKLT